MLVCCGLVTLDVVQRVGGLPGPNEKVVADGAEVAFGGPAANAAVTATALGIPTTLVTAVGGGPVADLVRGLLGSAGVRVVDLAGQDAGGPAVSTVLVQGGHRAVVSTNATVSPLTAERLEDAVAATGGEPPRTVLLDGHHMGLAVPYARWARDGGALTILDAGSWKPGTDELLAACDAVVLSADFTVPGPAAGVEADVLGLLNAVAGRGPSFVARSDGEAPIQVLAPEGLHRLPVEPTRVVDTLGAGDVLHGAFAAFAHGAAGAVPSGAVPLGAVTAGADAADGLPGVAAGPAGAPLGPTRAVGPTGWDALVDALARAAGVASESCRHPGAQGWIRARREGAGVGGSS